MLLIFLSVLMVTCDFWSQEVWLTICTHFLFLPKILTHVTRSFLLPFGKFERQCVLIPFDFQGRSSAICDVSLASSFQRHPRHGSGAGKRDQITLMFQEIIPTSSAGPSDFASVSRTQFFWIRPRRKESWRTWKLLDFAASTANQGPGYAHAQTAPWIGRCSRQSCSRSCCDGTGF